MPARMAPFSGGRDHLVADFQHDVHGADLVEVFVLHAVEPQHLGVAGFLRFLGAEQGRGIVAGGLGRAQPAFDGADIGVGGQDADRVHAFLVVSADRADDHVVQVAVRGMHAEEGLGRDDGGADIQRGARHRGHPALVDLHQRADRFLDHGGIEFRDAQVVRRAVEAAGVVGQAEEADLAVRAAKCFQAVEDRLAVVQDAGTRDPL